MRQTRSMVELGASKPSQCYKCQHYDWHIEFEKYIAGSFWVHECKADFEPGDEVQECAGFLRVTAP